MPLVTAALLVYVCGLLSGHSGLSAAPFAGAVAVAWLGGRDRRERVALAAIAVAGLAAGSASQRATEVCERRLLARSRAVELVLEDDGAPGAFVPARHPCGLRIRVSVASGRAAAGSRVQVSGAPSRGRAGLMLADATIRVVHGPGPLRRLRDALGRGLDARFGADAPLARALLIADMGDLSPAVRNRFAAAGLSHMLSVSGLHVGLIAAAVLLLAQLARVGRRSAQVAVVTLTAAYVVMIGAPLPAVRAAVMLGIVALSSATQRPTSPWAVLAVGAAAPVFDPRAVLDVGYQLSVAGMVALIAAAAVCRRWESLRAGGWRGTVVRGLVTSVAATLLTAPLVASTFGRVSLVAPLTNLAAAPAVALLQPMLFLAGALLPLPPAARFVADACHPLMAWLDRVAGWGAGLPGATVSVATDPSATTLAIGGAAALAAACVARRPGRALMVAATCVAWLVWRPLLPAPASLTEIHVLDIGQGDAIAVRSARGRWLLVDAGPAWGGADAGARDVLPYVMRHGLGSRAVAFVLSHPHADHVGGAASVVRSLRPEWYIDPAYAGATGAYRASLVAARESGTRWRRALPGDSIVLDEIVVTVLAPAPGWADTLRDPNEASVVVRIRVGGFRMLLAGDAEAREERWLVDNAAASLGADVLKVAHHGSATSSTDEFLDAVRPRLAVISVGAGNRYGHPSADVLRALAAHGAVTLRTDRLGTIVIRTDGRRVEVEAGGERWEVTQTSDRRP